jgi:hypothetical protein
MAKLFFMIFSLGLLLWALFDLFYVWISKLI